MLEKTGACTIGDSNACCGAGQCYKDASSNHTRCSCQSGYTGTVCQLNAQNVQYSANVLNLLVDRIVNASNTLTNTVSLLSATNLLAS